MNTWTFARHAFLGLVGASMLTGCGALNFVKSAQLNSFSQNGDQFGEVTLNLNTSQLAFPTLTLPLIDPTNPSKVDGTVALVNGSQGTELDITVDISAVAHLPKGSSSATLPNGEPLPIAGVDPASLLTFHVGSSEIYVDLNTASKKALFGTALVISEFNINATSDLFIPFNAGGVSGVAGVFTSTQAGQSGFAVFADVSNLVSTLDVPIKLSALELQGPRALAQARVGVESSYNFVGIQPSDSDLSKMKSMLKSLNRNKTQLHLE